MPELEGTADGMQEQAHTGGEERGHYRRERVCGPFGRRRTMVVTVGGVELRGGEHNVLMLAWAHEDDGDQRLACLTRFAVQGLYKTAL